MTEEAVTFEFYDPNAPTEEAPEDTEDPEAEPESGEVTE